MGVRKTVRKNGTEKFRGCTKETRVNERDTRADMPFIRTSWKTRCHLLDRCQLAHGEVVLALMSQELGRWGPVHQTEG